ncbi:MAG: NAD(P)/FAD-dependent oxidoreductase [Emcibacteraceae bacterium]|nr:NAD(P)/FAD-dependent oxidoreductase [Emcibacteraceae bacterium]
MSDHQDIVIIGAGVIGLAIAKNLSEIGRDVVILEREASFGMITSSRNSEVIHAGLYFTPEMLKTKLCVTGKEMLYDYAKSHHIPHKRCGKLLVAYDNDEIAKLETIKNKALANGIDDITHLSQAMCNELEPDIFALEGLYSPSSGVIDTHSYMLSMIGNIEDNGGMIAYNTEIKVIEKLTSGFKVTLSDGYAFTCNTLINSGGLGAQNVAKLIDAMPKTLIPELVMAKGHYFTYSGKAKFKHLVYPLPNKGSLGLHLCINYADEVKFGPDINIVEVEEYDVNIDLKSKFIDSVKRYFPKLEEDKLSPAFAGIRPKLSKEGLDFNIQTSDIHGIDGLINLFGMESPGMTSSLAIGKYVKDILK